MVLAIEIGLGNTLSEPICSKFHYEEQTLKSVVRLEFEMEKYKSALEDVQKLANNIMLKGDEYPQNHTDYIKDRIDEKLEDLEKRWEGRLQQVKTEIGMVYQQLNFIFFTKAKIKMCKSNFHFFRTTAIPR
jgi:hypothetical protein